MTTSAAPRLLFLRRAACQPDRIGTFFPTSPTMATELSRVLPSTGGPTVVEIGAGTGALCPSIRRRLDPTARYLAVEIDPPLVEHLQTSLPWLEVLEGDAADLGRLLTTAGVGAVDAVVSSLPWTLLQPEPRQRMIEEITRVLRPSGVFTTICCVPGLPHRRREFRRLLESSFDEVLTTATVWRNMPPARAFVCRRPRPAP
ncbi:class I SAM-dependent methyltransferase [Pseudonocardia sp. H11422]|uniref:class I SAM-dependent methyltransferase n=1 Tax=Pseudonocardia sp. H11422 TaxID=2835866 RepID=UPI0027E31FFC|nr:methyltransferase domain-containing protein [Pseudonocardia sp. H11422]